MGKRLGITYQIKKNQADMDHLTTEQNNPESVAIDQMDPIQIAMLMNREDLKVVAAVERVCRTSREPSSWSLSVYRQEVG